MDIDYKKEHNRYRYYFLRTKALYQQPAIKASTNLILTLLIISIFGFFAIKPTLITIAKLSKELKEKQEVNRILEKKINALKQAKDNYAEVLDYLPLVDKALPEKADFNGLASRINFLTFSHDLILFSASFGEFDLVTADAIGNNTFDFKISIAGSFVDIKNFLQDLENIDRIIQIDSVSFSTKPGAVKAELQADLNGRAFWLPKGNKDISKTKKEVE